MHRRSRWKRRALGALFGSVLATSLAAPAGGAPTEQCDPEPKVASSFCVSHEKTNEADAYLAAEPLDFTLDFQNTSAGTDNDDTRWIDRLRYRLPATTGEMVVDASLPDGLRLVGASGNCGGGPTYVGCPGGHGTLSVIMPFNPNDPGVTESGRFGIDSVIVDSPPAPENLVELELSAWVCLDVGFLDCIEGGMVIPAVIAKPPPGSPPELTLVTQLEGEIYWPPYGPLDWRGAMDTATVHLAGSSDTLSDGSPAGGTYTVLGAPARCGPAATSTTFSTAEATPRMLTFEHDELMIVDCPIGVFSAGVDGLAGVFNAAGTAFNGRSIEKYVWNFGDGSARTTTDAVVRHTYSKFGDRTVTLTLIDDAGAMSAPTTAVSKGTNITAKVTRPPGKVRVAGLVKPNKKGKVVLVTLLRKKAGKFRALSTQKVKLSRRSKYAASFARPSAGKCRTKSLFKGDAVHRGSYVVKTFAC